MIPVDDRSAERRRGLHMKIANLLLCCAVAASSLAAPARLHAQPVNAPGIAPPVAAPSIAPPVDAPVDAPNIAGGENMPWNKGVSQETRAAAREAFLEGNRLFKIPLFSRAVEKYGEALDKWKHPGFYFNLAIAQMNLGQWLEARENLELAMKYGPDPLRKDRFDEAKKQLVEVERHLGRILVRCPTPDAEVTLDAVTLFTGPGQREVWVTPTPHEVTAKKPEYSTQARRVPVAAGAHETVDLSLRKIFEDRPWAVWKPWAVFGSGVAIAAASGALHALSAHNFNSYDSQFVNLPCAAMHGCMDQQLHPHMPTLLSHAHLEQDIAVGGYIVGGSLLAAGAVLLYLNRPHVAEQRPGTSSDTGITIIPGISTNTFTVLVSVSN
jgi:tetratricopeptide (TPR) repeat protein